MRVAVDATSLIGTRTGIGRATAELLTRLPRPGLDLQAFAVSRRGARALRDDLPSGVGSIRRPMGARPLRECWRRWDAPVIEHWTGSVDAVWGPNFVVPPARDAAEIVTVHDLTCVHRPDLCTRTTLQVPGLLRRAIARGAWIHTVSEHVADDVRTVFAIDPDRVVAIPNGGPTSPDHDRIADLARRGQRIFGDRYVAFVGTLEPRKDLPTLIAAFAQIAADDPDLRLVLAGPDGWGSDEVAAAIARTAVADRIVRTGWLDDEMRDAVLAGATAFVYPSLLEGFGLPPLEAIALETPVVATRVGALPEVLADAARWAEPQSVESLSAALGDVIDDPTLRHELVGAGRARLAAHSWDRAADAMADLFQRAADERRQRLT